MSKDSFKLIRLTEHISYHITNNTVYLFEDDNVKTDEEHNVAYKKLALIIEDNDISYINITAKRIEDRKEIYQKEGFTLSYYDVNKLNLLFKNKKNKMLYRCYGIMTRGDFFKMMNGQNKSNKKEVVIKSNNNSGFVSSMLLLFGGVILLCYFCVMGAIYLIK